MAQTETTYLLRGIDPALWRRVKTKAASEGVSVKALLLNYLTKWAGAAVLVMLTATPAGAQSLKIPAVVFGAAGAADMATTVWFMNNSNLREANPLVSWIKEPVPMVLFGAAVETTIATLLTRKLAKRHPKWAAAGLYIAAGVHAGFAIRNARHMQIVNAMKANTNLMGR